MAERRLEPRSLAAHALLLIAILPLLGYLPFYYEESRYVGPYAPIGFIWCALGVLGLGARLAEALSRSDGRSRMRGPALSAACWAPAVGLWLLMATITALHGRRMDEVASMEYVEAGRWIDEHSEEGVTLWTTQSQIAFEAHRGWTYPPAPERLADPRGGRVLLAYDTRNFLAKRPEWRALLEPPSERWLRPLYTTQLPGPTVTIYEVQPPAAQGESR
jgi:hypothetical protein